MKKAIRRYFRYIRHTVCRYIYYFDACPKQFRKNYKELFLEGLACAALCFGATIFFFLLALMS